MHKGLSYPFVVVVVGTKITRSQDNGSVNGSVKICEKQCASNRMARPTSITNAAFLLAMPIDSAQTMCFLLTHSTSLLRDMGIGRQQKDVHSTLLIQVDANAACVYVLYRAKFLLGYQV